jgi:hypothetical protein
VRSKKATDKTGTGHNEMALLSGFLIAGGHLLHYYNKCIPSIAAARVGDEGNSQL